MRLLLTDVGFQIRQVFIRISDRDAHLLPVRVRLRVRGRLLLFVRLFNNAVVAALNNTV
jgi:hypothetical protein